MIADTFNQQLSWQEPNFEDLMNYKDMLITFDIYGYPSPKVPSIEDFTGVCDKEYWLDDVSFQKEYPVTEDNPNFPLDEFDSTKWAPEFKKIGVAQGLLSADIDDRPGSWLHTWFCCAIMTGYDNAMQIRDGWDREDELKETDDDLEYTFWGV